MKKRAEYFGFRKEIQIASCTLRVTHTSFSSKLSFPAKILFFFFSNIPFGPHLPGPLFFLFAHQHNFLKLQEIRKTSGWLHSEYMFSWFVGAVRSFVPVMFQFLQMFSSCNLLQHDQILLFSFCIVSRYFTIIFWFRKNKEKDV